MQEFWYDLIDRQGCPPFSELPIADEELKNFYGIRYYDDFGGQISSLACNGKSYDLPPGKYDSDGNIYTWYPIGTLFVHHGCTLYIFSKPGFVGEMSTYRGDLSDFCVDDFRFCLGCLCPIPSMIVECGMQFPDCKPTDEWTTVASLDNSGSSLPSKFTYEYQIGTEWSSEISEGFNIDASVTVTIKDSFFGLFEAEASSSFSTGYNWQSTSSEAKSEVKTFTIETEIPPGTVFKIYQAKGLCGNSEVQTELFKTEDSKTGDWKIFYH